jgi:riboflavin biosynthesis pyrimidine reductase
MREIRKMHQAVIMGATTFAACPEYLGLPTVVVSSRLGIPRHTPWERAVNKNRWIFCGKNAPKREVLRLRAAGVNVVVCRGARPDPHTILRQLRKAGWKKVLLEGGGELNASFLNLGLVNQIFLTLCPLTIGGDSSPTFYEGEGGAVYHWDLKRSRRVGDELYLEYKRGKRHSGDLRP